MNDILAITQASAVASFPVKLTVSDEVQANRRPVTAVLFRAGILSIAPPFGADKRVLIDRQAIEKIDLDKLVGLPFHADFNLSSHWSDVGGKKLAIAVGAIVEAERNDNAIIGHGFLWDLDYPDIVAKIREASNEDRLAISWEIIDVVMKDEGDYYRIYSFTPTGFALLRAENAAFRDLMPALAAIQNKQRYIPSEQKLAVLLDDHRILHAYYATLRRGGTVADWTISEVVKLHAKIADEMMLRHVHHKRGDGLSRSLNEESLSHQHFQFFTDEMLNNVAEIWAVDKQFASKAIKKASRHEKIQLDDKPESVPLGVPIALSVDDKIVACGSIARIEGSYFLALPEVYKRPISLKKVQASISDWKERLKIAAELIDKLPDVIVVPGYIAVTGSSLLTPKARDLDILICDNGMFSKLSSYFSEFNPHVTLTDKPAGLSIPTYDVMLVKNVRSPIEPVADAFTEKLVEHVTVTSEDAVGLVAARMRSLGDLDVYPLGAYYTETIPTKRGLLKVTDESAEIYTYEDEVIALTYLLAYKPESCLSLVAEVWYSEDASWMVADCLWWNATKVSDLPFPWRLAFTRKIAEAFMLPMVEWKMLMNPKEISSLRAFVLQDQQAVYSAPRLVVFNKLATGGASYGRSRSDCSVSPSEGGCDEATS
jgi:hypothetical protein